MQSMEAHTETLHYVVDTCGKCFNQRTVTTCQKFFTAWETLWTTSLNVCRSMRIVLECCHRELSLCVCMCVCAWYNDQPGLKVYMCNHTIIRKTSGWTLDGLCRYKCTGDCVRVNVFNHRSAFGYTTMTFNIYYYWKIHDQLLSLQCKTHATVLETHRLTSPLPYRPVQTPCLRHPTCLSISDYKPSNSSLCLNDRPFICVSALSSYMTLMALTSCKPQQLAVWVHECV